MSTHTTLKTEHPYKYSKNAVVRARINADLKDDVETILDKLGLTMSETISLYLAQIRLTQGIPFDIKIPNKETEKAIREARAKKGIITCKNSKDLIKKLGL